MDPLQVACSHVSDDGYNCSAQPGEACCWDHRVSSGPHPDFHAERLETAAFVANPATTDEVDAGKFDKAVEDSGLV